MLHHFEMCDSSSFCFFFFFLRIEFPLQNEKPLIFMKSFKKFSSFIFWNLLMEICPLKICLGDFSFSGRSVHGDLSFDDFFRGFFLFHEDLFMEIFPLKFWIGDLSLEDLFRRFFLWRFVHGDFSFYKDVVMEICPLKIWSLGDFSFYEDMFMEIFPLKICS